MRSVFLLLALAVSASFPGQALASWLNQKDIQSFLEANRQSEDPADQAYVRKLEAALKDPRLKDEGVVWVDDGEGDRGRYPGLQPGSPAKARGWALYFLTTSEGKEWLASEDRGRQWLATDEAKDWLKTAEGKNWKALQDRAPTGLELRVLGGDRLKLTWAESGDLYADVAIEICPEGKKWSQHVKLPGGQNSYLVKGLAPGTTYRFRLRGMGPKNEGAISEPQTATMRPRILHVLAVGVSVYGDREFALKYASDDARAFAAAWKKQEGQGFGRVNVKVLTDEEASRGEIVKGLQWIGQNATQSDWSLFMFAGRGGVDEQQEYWLCPRDFDPRNRPGTTLRAQDINPFLDKAKGSLVFLDTPFADAAAKSFAKTTGRLVLAAEGRGFELDKLSQGAFTRSFLDCLAAPTESDRDGDNLLSVEELESALSSGLNRWTSGKQRLIKLGAVSCPPLQVRDK